MAKIINTYIKNKMLYLESASFLQIKLSWGIKSPLYKPLQFKLFQENHFPSLTGTLLSSPRDKTPAPEASDRWEKGKGLLRLGWEQESRTSSVSGITTPLRKGQGAREHPFCSRGYVTKFDFEAQRRNWRAEQAPSPARSLAYLWD